MKSGILICVVLAAGLAGSITAQMRIDTAKAANPQQDELLYLPNERLLNSFTGGLSSVVADVLWLQCIQYTSREFRGDFKFTWLSHMTTTITRLDPHFVDVYKWGGIFLAMLKNDSDAGIDLLKRGMQANPTQWELPFEIARTYVLNRHDEVNGARYMAIAAETGNPPLFVVNWAKNLQQRHNLFDVERGMWQEIIRGAKDQNMLIMAKRRLIEVDLREVCAVLNQAMTTYEQKTGKGTGQLSDLVTAGVVAQIPADPLGGKFFVDAKGIVQSTSVLESVKEERRVLLRGWIEQFRKREGRWPSELKELVDRQYTNGLPQNPLGEWRYNAADGTLE